MIGNEDASEWPFAEEPEEPEIDEDADDPDYYEPEPPAPVEPPSGDGPRAPLKPGAAKVRPSPARSAAPPRGAARPKIRPAGPLRAPKAGRSGKKKLGYESIEDRVIPNKRLTSKIKATKFPSSYDGGSDKSYSGIRTQLYAQFYKRAEVETDDPVAGPQSWPDLSNGELIALVRAWKRAAARSSHPSWPISYDLLLSGLGWSKEGDQFVMTRDHATRPASALAIKLFWIATDDLAVQLDSATTKRYPLIVDWSYSGYEQAARDAWHEMQLARLPPLPDRPPPSPIDPVLPELPSIDGGGILLVLLIAAYVITRKKR